MLQTQNFPAGGRQIDAKANFFRYETCLIGGADESIRVKADGNDLGLFLPGDYVDLPIYASRWEVIPSTATATGTVRLGNGKVGSSRLTGTVSIVDGERLKVLSGVCFRGSAAQAGAGVAGAVVQLFNPAGSGKNFFVSNTRLGGSANDTWYLFTTTTQAPVLQGTAGNIDRIQPNSTGTIRRGNDATTYVSTVSLGIGFFSPNIDLVVPFAKPVLLRPGYGLNMQCQTVTPTVNTVFEWEEWPA